MQEKNYNTYKLSLTELLIYLLLFLMTAFVYSLLFFDSLIPVFLSLTLLKLYFKLVRKKLVSKQKYRLLLQFKEWLFSLNASLNSGFALENAIKESLTELKSLFGEKSDIYMEVKLMCNKLLLHIPLEEILNNFAVRSDLEDVKIFSEIITLVKKNGGDMIGIIKNTSATISSEIDLKNKIAASVASTKYELYIMAAFPLIIIKYVDMTQPGFFDSLYHNLFGVCVMSVCLLTYFGSLFIANKILNITRRI